MVKSQEMLKKLKIKGSTKITFISNQNVLQAKQIQKHLTYLKKSAMKLL